MIDATKIESALLGTLANDATLIGLLPDGVYWDLARQGATRFAIVSLSSSRALGEFHETDTLRAFVYIVKAVCLGTGKDPIVAADARIQTLLDTREIAIPADAGCTLMAAIRWVDRVRYTETAESDTWQHRGARYEITVTPN